MEQYLAINYMCQFEIFFRKTGLYTSPDPGQLKANLKPIKSQLKFTLSAVNFIQI